MFNIRIYGLLINEKQELLVADEHIKGKFYTKFPGGGLEYGEGTRDCLKREFMEEMNLKVEVGDHFYTTDFFQLNAFSSEKQQIISIYYEVKPLEPITKEVKSKPFDFDETQQEDYKTSLNIESFRLIPLSDLTLESVTLPIDKVVVQMLLQKRNRYSGAD